MGFIFAEGRLWEVLSPWNFQPECFHLTKHTPVTRRLVKYPQKRKCHCQSGLGGPIARDSDSALGAEASVGGLSNTKEEITPGCIPFRKW